MTSVAPASCRILLVEDEPADARLVVLEIRQAADGPFSIIQAGTLAEAEAVIAAADPQAPFDVVLLDLSLPDSFGLDTLRRLSARLPAGCPVLILTGNDDYNTALVAVEAGAQDYLVKGRADGAQLWRAIHHAIRRKQLEERLRLSEERFKAVFTLARDPIVAVDGDLALVLFNRAAEEVFGWTAAEAMGRPLEILLRDTDRAKVTARFRDFFASQDTVMNDYAEAGLWAVDRNGREFVADASVSKVVVPDGFIVVAAIRDVTERREAQLAVERQAAEMAALAERLDAALMEAEQASASKSEFLAMMSHEIRTPMNGILGMARLLLDRPMPPDQREKLEIIHDSGEALLAILNDILDFSKLEAGRVELEETDFDLTRVVRSTVALMDSRAKEKGVDLAVAISGKVARVVVGDPGRLRQILLNLVGNAVKFTDRGHVGVLVDEMRRDDMEAWIRFVVEDTGIGIDPVAQTRLFQSFQQADASVARRFGGSGLGLAICKRLVELMGGEIGLTSEPAVGSRFHFEAPFRIADRAELAAPCAAAPVTLAPSSIPMSILLAEDNAVNQMVVRGFLEGRGHTVTTVVNGAEAVEALRTLTFDAVLMDMEMPVMNGLDATRAIRGLSNASAAVPIIALTANAMQGDAERCLAAGMDDYLRKPVVPEELFLALSRAARAVVARGGEADEHPCTAAVLDTVTFQALRDAMGADIIVQLIDHFVMDVEPRVERIVAACAEGHMGEARQDAHDTKSMSATFGLAALAELAQTIEHACRDGDAARARSSGRELPLALSRALSALNEAVG